MERLKDLIAMRILAPAMERRTGVNGRRFIADVANIQESSFDEIRAHQLRRLRVVATAAEGFPVFADRLRAAHINHVGELEFEDLLQLQPVDREDIRSMARYVEGSGSLNNSVIKSATGGTTSAPVTFYMEREAVEHRRAATRYFDGRLGYAPGKRIAYLWGAVQDIPNYHGISGYLRQQWIDRSLFLPSNHLQADEMFEYYRRLQKFKPCLLQAYATPLVLFSKFLLDNRLTLSIPAVTSTAEVLTDEHCSIVAEAFGSAPIRWYGARDAGRIATECSAADGLHINCYGLYVETSKELGIGRVLVTDLWNTLMPIIRYDIGDVAELDSSPCSCGNEAPRLRRLEGRVADILIGSDGRLVPGVTMTNRIVSASDEIRAMQIIQSQKGIFIIRIVPGADYNHRESDLMLVQQFNRLMESVNKVSVEQVSEIPVEKSGKVRFCKNEMRLEELRRYI